MGHLAPRVRDLKCPGWGAPNAPGEGHAAPRGAGCPGFVFTSPRSTPYTIGRCVSSSPSPSPAPRDALAALQAKLIETRGDVSWTAPQKIHLTIKFLGETAETFLPELSARLTRAAAQVPQFPIDLDGLTRFPERGPPRTLVAHAFSPDHRLIRLHRLIDSAVGGIGLPMDTRELSPHVTLGRVRSNHGVNRLLRLLDKHEADFIGTFTAETVTLFQSIPTPEGTAHKPLHSAPLHAAQPASGIDVQN